MVRAVVFDLFETLVTESGTRPAGVSSLAPTLGCEREAFRAKWKALRPKVTIGELSFHQALGEIATSLKGHVDDDTLQRMCNERVRAKAQPFEQIEPRVVTMIDWLRRRELRLGVISNCFAEDVVAWPHCSLASRFDSTLFSFQIGVAKPDREIYVEATRRLRVDASETWFIGDGTDDELSGADQAGLRPFRARWFLRRWPHFREEQSAGVASIGELDEIEEIVGLVERASGPLS